MDLFGLMAVEQPPRPVTTWHPTPSTSIGYLVVEVSVHV